MEKPAEEVICSTSSQPCVSGTLPLATICWQTILDKEIERKSIGVDLNQLKIPSKQFAFLQSINQACKWHVKKIA